jgi:hypothetical protein
MAGIEDALRFLEPEYIDKAKEILSDPMGSGAGIVDAIKDFDAIEAANFVKDKVIETAFGESNVDDMIIGGGVGGGSTELPGIISQAGDFVLDQAGIPIDMSTVSDVGTAFTDQGAGGVIEVAKNQAINLIKNGLVNEGIALASQANIPVATILALANNKITGPVVRGAGNEFANLGYDVSNIFGLGNIYDSGLNLFGINREKDEPDPPVVIQQPTPDPTPVFTPVFTPPPATSNEAEVAYGGQQVDPGGGGSYGGGEDFGSPFASPPSPPRGPDLTNRANGGLVSVSRYLKGR